MKPLIKWGFWQRRWSVLWWCIGTLAFVVLVLVFYPAIRGQASQYNQLMSSIPQSARGLISDTADIFSPIGYLSSQVFYTMMPLILGFLAISLGASLVGHEERDGTIELLLGRPVSRNRLISAKAILGVIILIIVGLVGALSSAVMAKLVKLDVSFIDIVLAAFACIVMTLSWGAIAFTITMLGRGARAASIGIATMVAILGYILASLSDTVKWLVWPARAFPFHYYHPADILRGTYHWQDLIFMAIVIIICAVVSVLAFRRRDLVNN